MTTFDRLLEPVMPILKEIEQERVPHFNETHPWSLFVTGFSLSFYDGIPVDA